MPSEKLKPCEPCPHCGAKAAVYDKDYFIIHHNAECYWALLKFNPQYVHVSNQLKWNTRAHPPVSEDEARKRAEQLVREWTEEVGLTEAEALDGNTIESLVGFIVTDFGGEYRRGVEDAAEIAERYDDYRGDNNVADEIALQIRALLEKE